MFNIRKGVLFTEHLWATGSSQDYFTLTLFKTKNKTNFSSLVSLFYLNHFISLFSLSTTPWKHQMFSDIFRAYRKTIACESLKSVYFSKIFWGKKVISSSVFKIFLACLFFTKFYLMPQKYETFFLVGLLKSGYHLTKRFLLIVLLKTH